MKVIVLFQLSLLFLGAFARSVKPYCHGFTIPRELLIGVATSAAQIEGAWNENGKGESIVDHYVHSHPDITNNSTQEVATNYYHRYKEDIQLIKNISLEVYRFSLSWTRIFPSGDVSKPNRDGVQFYHNILNELETKSIIPFVTIYHWDHPQILEDRFNGWQNEKMAYAFADYAKFVFQEYGDRVKNFITINEPQAFCQWGLTDTIYRQYTSGDTSTESYYLCVHNMLKGHALAYDIYNKLFRKEQNGLVGIAQTCSFFYNDQNDPRAVEYALEFNCGGVSHAIFSESGDYPKLMKNIVAKRSRAQGLTKSKLPEFDSTWIEKIRHSSDFFGLMYYTSRMVKSLPLSEIANWKNDEGLYYYNAEDWPSSQVSLMPVVPKGFRDVLKLIKKQYNNLPIYVMETGVSDNSSVYDVSRINFMYSHMKEMLIAMKENKCNVKAYILWSLTDSFEWYGGYFMKFGLVNVNYENGSLNRTLKESAKWIKPVIESRCLYPELVNEISSSMN